MTKSIFSATFAESKNLLNDYFYKNNKANQANTHRRFNYNHTKILVAETAATIFFVLFFFILPCWVVSYLCTKEAIEKGIPNFFPFFIFKGGLFLLLIFGIVSLIAPNYLKVFWSKFDLSFIRRSLAIN
ncbi:hypothetical protein [Fructilactobacillus carniphilus]|uniref:Uncharacterized protein n=1 Tax=Fructilactobacillus carniphilus TaxID=2940297 RepID=A0ABY5BUW3_9LACO|nr:hypothetical protein [Fructilactobacillus carniphilus]USS90291.1 hypothetical protein M3M37_05460 [Fructilactobacillus carniphilus]